jgi:hypothetical protein
MAGNPWSLLAVTAVNAKDKFRKKVTDPRSLNPTSHITPHPEFDDKTFSALESLLQRDDAYRMIISLCNWQRALEAGERWSTFQFPSETTPL